jgi:DNA polymerase elongation subunit (family B)
MQTLHIYDCLSRDERILKETEDEKEVEYLSANESDDSEYQSRRRKQSGGGDKKSLHMVIHLFGMNADGEAVRVDVSGFRPYFFVSLPDNQTGYDAIEKKLRAKIKTDVDLIDFKIENHQKFYGYTGGKPFRFVRMSFQSMSLFYTVRKEFLDERNQPKMVLRVGEAALDVYESNIDPMLRFFHLRGVTPCGWAGVKGEEVESETGIRIQCQWTDVSVPTSTPGIAPSAPLLHAFWDIECYSENGEFPLPKKNYERISKLIAQHATSVENAKELLLNAVLYPDNPPENMSSLPLMRRRAGTQRCMTRRGAALRFEVPASVAAQWR